MLASYPPMFILNFNSTTCTVSCTIPLSLRFLMQFHWRQVKIDHWSCRYRPANILLHIQRGDSLMHVLAQRKEGEHCTCAFIYQIYYLAWTHFIYIDLLYAGAGYAFTVDGILPYSAIITKVQTAEGNRACGKEGHMVMVMTIGRTGRTQYYIVR